ncbi:MAG: hypothetical protein NDI82_05155 [Anaeromyxobacteraceae bacterium]|nr:hypothetical protein [Anaeromyxobacteraceae bacterium]
MELHDVKALEAVLHALKDLEPAVKERVLRWAAESLDLRMQLKAPAKTEAPAAGGPSNTGAGGTGLDSFETVADAFAAARVRTAADRVLLGAAYLSKKQGKAELASAEINVALKNMGHAVASINKIIDLLKDRKPQLMIQTRKSGNSRQARKLYKVTSAGFDKVEAMLSAEGGED